MNRKIIFGILLLACGAFALTTLVSWTLPEPSPAAIQASVVKSFTLLQKSGASFIAKGRCGACHHSTLTAMVANKMRSKGIAHTDTTAAMRTFAMNQTLFHIGNPNRNNQFVQAKFLTPYVLVGLGAEQYPADFNTDIAVDYIMGQALPDGSFKAEYARVPLESGDIHLTAFAIRAIQWYASPAKAARVQQLVAQTRQWLEKQAPTEQQELSFQLLAMQWCGSTAAAKTAVAQKLLALQNRDHGWSQLPTMGSDAYATGQALYALSEAGLADLHREAYQNGLNYLLQTQEDNGAWVVMTRSNPIQPYLNAEFPPYDENQFISAAASNWAALALADALPDRH